jgi:hypothetical protein
MISEFESLFLEDVDALDPDDIDSQQSEYLFSVTSVKSSGLRSLSETRVESLGEGQLSKISEQSEDIDDPLTSNEDWLQFMQSADAMQNNMNDFACSICVDQYNQRPIVLAQTQKTEDSLPWELTFSKINEDIKTSHDNEKLMSNPNYAAEDVAEVQVVLSDMVRTVWYELYFSISGSIDNYGLLGSRGRIFSFFHYS